MNTWTALDHILQHFDKSMTLETANRTNTSFKRTQEFNLAPSAFLITCDLSKEAAGQKNSLKELKTRNYFLTILVVQM